MEMPEQGDEIGVSEAKTFGGSDEGWRALTMDAYSRFHVKLTEIRSSFPSLTDFAPVDRVGSTAGTFAWFWGAASEVRETINSANAWGVRLHEWRAWWEVIQSYESDHDKWEVSYHFVEPIAYYCMLQPSSLADQLMVLTETLLHQANRTVFPNYPDLLDQDNMGGRKVLGRSKRHKQLNRLGKSWSSYEDFRCAFSVLDGDAYRAATGNFRDLSAHSYAPRFMSGTISRAIRSIVPLQVEMYQSDGDFFLVEDEARTTVSYGMNVLYPLPFEEAYEANLGEYQRLLAALRALSYLITEICARIDEISKGAP